jgi:hypothetical protein
VSELKNFGVETTIILAAFSSGQKVAPPKLF